MILSKFRCLKAGLGIIALCLILFSCKKQDETNISDYNGTESHNMGKNCMDCHYKNGQGKGWFVVAGTVYDTIFPYNSPNPNATVFLYTQYGGKGTLAAKLKGDAKGNFYSTENVNFGSGLYPVVVSAKNNIKYMNAAITHGECSGCHNFDTFKIYIK
jgi:hypothetical protein